MQLCLDLVPLLHSGRNSGPGCHAVSRDETRQRLSLGGCALLALSRALLARRRDAAAHLWPPMGIVSGDVGAGGEAGGPARPSVAVVVVGGASTSDDMSDSPSSARLLTPDSGQDEQEEEDGNVELRHLDRTRGQKQRDRPSGPRRSSARRRGRPSYTAEEERAIVRKFDRRLVLFVALLYMLSFLDRSSK